MTFKYSFLIAGAVALFPSFGFASDGISESQVTFAQIAALDGPAAALGTGMRLGLTAAFEEVNASGGVHGRMVHMDSFDDGYEPDRSIQQVQSILSANQHIGLIGMVGTPTSAATQPIATDANIPYLGPFTGAGFLRDPAFTNVMNVRATYAAETEAWIKYLVDQQGMQSIAILYQDDGFGRVGLEGVTEALEKRGMTLAAEGTYTRNTTAVKGALLEIRKAEPDAVVMVGAYKPVAEFIKTARKLKFNPTFVNISFVGSVALANELGEAGEDVIISQVVPFPWDDTVTVVARYQAALAAVDPAAEPDFVSLEGYLTGRLAIEVLRAAGKDLTRDSFLSAVMNMGSVDFGGVNMTFGPGDNQGMDSVFLTRITEAGTFEPVAIDGSS
ncbi:MAG: ABC transporter substrate-binding protein [Pseudomonadota bacterium]